MVGVVEMVEMVDKADMVAMADVVVMAVVVVTVVTEETVVLEVKETVPMESLADDPVKVGTVPEVETVEMAVMAEMVLPVDAVVMVEMVPEVVMVVTYTFKFMEIRRSGNAPYKFSNFALLVDRAEMEVQQGLEAIPVREDEQDMRVLQGLAVLRVLAINMERVVHPDRLVSLVDQVAKWDYDTAMPAMDTMARVDTPAT